ncbi:beta-1,3-galactosyl-O-glycosyl-glycoprotein beta-1,6-N-acetylglucosaminyltransferase-like [Mytilus trossulus]|uniref:beta-1,3-galactosyl-O-glycosyl-glycoprotein beta-1,6-N-acetylglucosaminyltransferase-like n=1 Tax=Mytilus trossulus TaxID=6551 RepID=UPI003005C572
MFLSSLKKQFDFYNKNRRKILVVCLSLLILFCLVFGGINHATCCIQFKDQISKTYLRGFYSDIQKQKVIDPPTTCIPKHINCIKLVMGEREELKKASGYIKHNKIGNKCQLINLVENCNALKIAHNYVTDNKTIFKEELEFPLAFAIKMHTSPEQAEQLLRNIYRPHNVYCIYVDKKSKEETFNLIQKVGNCFDNIFIVENRIEVVYSSINLVEAEVECMRIVSKSKKNWKYYINLTGQEFPLKTNLEIVKILQRLNGANDIESYEYPFIMQQRYTKEHVIKGNSIHKTKNLKHSFIKRFQMSKGSAYGAFSKPFVDFILTDNIARMFLKWLNGTYAPEESAWATLNTLPWTPGGFHKKAKNPTASFLSRAVIWSWDKSRCRGHYIRGICVYESGDLPWLAHREELFANKFDINRDHVVLDCLEEVLRNRTKDNKVENLNWDFYNTLPHAEYYAKFRQMKSSNNYLQRKKEMWLKDHNVTEMLEPISSRE